MTLEGTSLRKLHSSITILFKGDDPSSKEYEYSEVVVFIYIARIKVFKILR